MALGFSGLGNAMWNALIVGVLVGILALSVTREKPRAA
ncbi:SPW repeat protein [Thermus sp.]|nr:SPW repeat protein [Thermus neutrinimicus]